MLKKITAIAVASMLSLTSVSANTQATEVSLKKILKKHEYKLTVHPQAHKEEFKAKAMTDLKAEISKFASASTTEELRSEFKAIVDEIPSQEKKDEYLKLLKNSTKSELEGFLAKPSLLSDALRGEGSNFTGNGGVDAGDLLVALGAALVIWIVIEAISDSVNYQRYYSYTIDYTLYSYSHSASCSSYDLDSWERDALKADAYAKCRSRANNPSTCRFSHYDVDTYQDIYYDHIYDCEVQAVYKAEK